VPLPLPAGTGRVSLEGGETLEIDGGAARVDVETGPEDVTVRGVVFGR
jgi:hypothetical protein